MTEDTRKTRMIYIRVTQKEYDQLKILSKPHGGMSRVIRAFIAYVWNRACATDQT